MTSIETYRKRAKQLMRWHRDRNYSVGEKLRLLDRYRHLTDAEILSMALPLTLAQEVVAVEAGFKTWVSLKASTGDAKGKRLENTAGPEIKAAVPILFVRDVATAADFYIEKLGFSLDFLHGKPAFYGSVSRDGVCLHLRHVARPNFAELAAHETSLILASFETSNAKALFKEYEGTGVDFAQKLVRQTWGGLDFQIRDPDGNVISFVEYRDRDDI